MQLVEIKAKRALHRAVNHELMSSGIEQWYACVVALEMQPGRRDSALQMLERRARGATARSAGLGTNSRMDDISLVV